MLVMQAITLQTDFFFLQSKTQKKKYMEFIQVITYQPRISILKQKKKTAYTITCSDQISSRKFYMTFIQVITSQLGFSVLKPRKTAHTITCNNQISSIKFRMAFIQVIISKLGFSVLKPRKTAHTITCNNQISSRKFLHGIHSGNNKSTQPNAISMAPNKEINKEERSLTS